MRFLNLTPHAITVLVAEGVETIFLATTLAARVQVSSTDLDSIAGFRLRTQTFGEVENLPAPQADTIYIVSAIVLAALKGRRPDAGAPDTGPDAVRENGQIKAVRGFVQ